MSWDEIKRRVIGGTPEWCDEEDCFFYGDTRCTECEECTYCGTPIGPRGRNRHKAHAFLPESSGGRTWVPTCMSCNLSQGTEGLVSWLRRLHEEDPKLYQTIVAHQRDRWSGWTGGLDKIAKKILELDERL
jgi:5-methylcytosine-specific restriction endonuclease McrA